MVMYGIAFEVADVHLAKVSQRAEIVLNLQQYIEYNQGIPAYTYIFEGDDEVYSDPMYE